MQLNLQRRTNGNSPSRANNEWNDYVHWNLKKNPRKILKLKRRAWSLNKGEIVERKFLHFPHVCDHRLNLSFNLKLSSYSDFEYFPILITVLHRLKVWSITVCCQQAFDWNCYSFSSSKTIQSLTTFLWISSQVKIIEVSDRNKFLLRENVEKKQRWKQEQRWKLKKCKSSNS